MPMKSGYCMTAAILAAVALTAAGSHSKQSVPNESSVETAAAQLAMAACASGVGDSNRFVVPKAGGGTRTMEICGGGAKGDQAATARALSDAIDAARDDDKFYNHPRMPELLALRVLRARTDIDPSLKSDERMKRLSRLNDEISSLESDISKTTSAR
jgi:hypothetical protein